MHACAHTSSSSYHHHITLHHITPHHTTPHHTTPHPTTPHTTFPHDADLWGDAGHAGKAGEEQRDQRSCYGYVFGARKERRGEQTAQARAAQVRARVCVRTLLCDRRQARNRVCASRTRSRTQYRHSCNVHDEKQHTTTTPRRLLQPITINISTASAKKKLKQK